MRSTAVLAVAVAVALAGCGSSIKPNSNHGSLDPGIKFADCMRANGVPSFPDPSGGGGVQVGNPVDLKSPAFQRAQKRCGGLLPAPTSRAPATAAQKKMMLTLSQCMRAHGVSGFPDPVSSPPASPTGTAFAFGRPGAFIVVAQALQPQSPVFKQAAKACHFPGA